MSQSVSTLADQLKPYVVKWINAAMQNGASGGGGGGGGGGLAQHALDGFYHTGTLADSQAPQFPLLAGGRTYTGNLVLLDGLTVDGVDVSEHVLNPAAHHSPVTAGDGIDLSGQQVAVDVTDLLGAGITEVGGDNNLAVNQGYAFAWTANHTHAGNVQFIGARTINSDGANNLTIGAGGDLILDPTGNVQVPNAQNIQTTDFADLVTGIAGMRLYDIGSNYRAIVGGYAKFDEMHVRVFTADEVRIDRGEEYWAKSYGIVMADFVVPAAISNTVVVSFEDAPALPGADLFTTGDWILFRTIDWTTGLEVTKHWFTVGAKYSSGTGWQAWPLVLQYGTFGTKIKAGQVGLDMGASGAGWVHLLAYKNSGGPFIQLGDWSTNYGSNAPNSRPYHADAFIPRVRIGNLNGVGGIASDTWGFAAAKNLGTSIGSGFQGIVIDPTNGVRLYNADVKLYDGATQTIWMNATDGLTMLANDTGLAGPYNVVGIALWDELRSVSFWDGSTRFATLGGTKYTAPTPDEWGVSLDVIAPASSQRAALQLSVASTGATVTDTNPVLFLEHSGSVNRATLAAHQVLLRGGEKYVWGEEGQDAALYHYADEGDDNADRWYVGAVAGANGSYVFRNYATGSWVTVLSLTNTAGGYTGIGSGVIVADDYVVAPAVQAYDANGLSIQDDGGNEVIKIEDGGTAKIFGIGRSFQASKNIGDNVATGVIRITNTGTKRDAILHIRLQLRSSVDGGYVTAVEAWMAAIRWYSSGNASSSVAVLARARTTSVGSGFANIGDATLTIPTDSANRRFDITVQCDHSGSSGGTVVCDMLVELYSDNLSYWTIAAL